jgi:hypothetical protein
MTVCRNLGFMVNALDDFPSAVAEAEDTSDPVSTGLPERTGVAGVADPGRSRARVAEVTER